MQQLITGLLFVGGGGAYQPLYTSLALSFTFLNLFQNLSYSKSLLPGAELPS